ncbi:hypothetical protein [Streptomyces sp. NPDC058451]|uniref:hypothetical protein n=1 Tax=Streptomyces sp. NPDC058451 TaxID=3346506 RepID=UPI003646CA54
MTQILVTAVATAVAVIAALEHIPRALTRLVHACMPLVQAWQALVQAACKDSSTHAMHSTAPQISPDGTAESAAPKKNRSASGKGPIP